MKSQVIRFSRLFVALLLSMVCAVALTPLPHERAYAESGLVVGQGVEATIDGGQALGQVADQEPAEDPVSYDGVGIEVRAKTQGAGWGDWTDSGDTAGAVKSKGINALKLRLTDIEGMTGSVYYQTYKRGSGWKAQVANGKTTGSARYVEAVKIKLVGDVARHYDVLYRTYVNGRGWQPWVKNNAKSGVTNKKTQVNAVQVKLSPKTEEAAGKTIEKVGVRYEARFAATGWQAWKGDGKTAGKANKMLNGLAVKVDAGTLSGGVQYRAYNVKSHWTDWKTNGAFAGATANRLDAIKIKLTGDIAKTYNIWYRAYVQGAGWLDWAKNGQKAGSSGFGLRLEAFQVKLVKKASAAPGETKYRTVNQMEKGETLNGIDIASYQGDGGINVASIGADFVIVKSTQGNWYTNPYFRQHADATLASGKLLGIYHYADLRGSATAQAKYFVKSVEPYIGKAVLVLDYEADILSLGNTVSWAKKFLDKVHSLTGVKPLIYLSQSETWAHNWSSVAKTYNLWVAQYLYANMNSNGYLSGISHWDIGYWGSAIMYQYSSTAKLPGYGQRLDVDKFYGSILTWRKLQRAS